ncbi:MAG TPA: transposase [Aquabacterium sp.]|uniref:transposase n=1 Tax=Aquabacterium sp. TaxID=1872578 RepID=UPI002E376C52|nr:transposase [Aquabacterium sp.]HEX5372672.1 transposase [Aquabacterium sp.]
MARLPRLELAQWPHLMVQRVRPGEALVRDAEDRKALWLAMVDAARAHQVAVHAYVVLEDHFHLVATPARPGTLGAFMQSIGRRYVASYNRRHARQGTLWAGRFRATVLDPARYLLDAMALVELHRGGEGPAEPGLSSLAHHLHQRTDALVQDHALFWALGNTPFEREVVWRRRLEAGLSSAQVATLAQAMDKGWALVDASSLPALEGLSGRRMAPRPRGRPRTSAQSTDRGARDASSTPEPSSHQDGV